MKFLSLALLALLGPEAMAAPFSENIPSLSKRSSPISVDLPSNIDTTGLKLKAKEVTAVGSTSVAITARNVQLMTVGSRSMTAAEWSDWVSSYQVKFGSGSMDVSSLMQDRFIAVRSCL